MAAQILHQDRYHRTPCRLPKVKTHTRLIGKVVREPPQPQRIDVADRIPPTYD
jgi:hypothetical protein